MAWKLSMTMAFFNAPFAASISSVAWAGLTRVMAPKPAPAPTTSSVPFWSRMPPVNVLLPDRTSVPCPLTTSEPAPSSSVWSLDPVMSAIASLITMVCPAPGAKVTLCWPCRKRPLPSPEPVVTGPGK